MFYIYIYIYAFSRRFYPKRLTLHSSYSFTFYQLLLSLGIEPMILALLAPCSTIWATGKPSCFIDVLADVNPNRKYSSSLLLLWLLAKMITTHENPHAESELTLTFVFVEMFLMQYEELNMLSVCFWRPSTFCLDFSASVILAVFYKRCRNIEMWLKMHCVCIVFRAQQHLSQCLRSLWWTKSCIFMKTQWRRPIFTS